MDATPKPLSTMDLIATKKTTPYGRRPSWDTNKKYRNWVFTIQGQDELLFKTVLSNPAWKYVIIGREQGEHEHPHYQGFGMFENQRSQAAVSKLLGGAWCEPALVNEACITYCKKEGDYAEAGVPPKTTVELAQSMYDLIGELLPLEDDGESIDDDHEDVIISMQSLLDELMFIHDETHEYLAESVYDNNPLIITEE